MNQQLTEKEWQDILHALKKGDNEPYWSQIVLPYHEDLIQQLRRRYHCDFEKAHDIVIDFFIRFRNGLIEGKYYGAYKKLYAFCWIAIRNDYLIGEGKRMKWYNHLERIIQGVDYKSYKKQDYSDSDEEFLTSLIIMMGEIRKITCDRCLDIVYLNKVLKIKLRAIYEELKEPKPSFDAWKRAYNLCLKRMKENAAALLNNNQNIQPCKKK